MIIQGLLMILIILAATRTNAGRLAMKVVESPVAYGFNNDLISPASNHERLNLLIPPRNFSGPAQLQQLVGKCFNFTSEQYMYKFCPFNNVSQTELGDRWNAYQGILGIWQEWKISNNTFQSMLMLNGDNCGSVDRSVEVLLECGETDKIRDMMEPIKCQYKMLFQTRLVCHKDSVLVYPRLPTHLQSQWDQLLTDLELGDITQKGYDGGLSRIFIEAGYQIPKPAQNESQKIKFLGLKLNNDTSKYSECLQEVAELKGEIEALKLLLELNTLPSHLKK